MSVLSRTVDWLRRTPKTPEEVEAQQEAQKIRYEEESIKSAQITAPGAMRDQYKWPS